MTPALAQTGWRKALGAPQATRWLWLPALAVSLPALALGYVLDDLQQQAMFKGSYDSAQRGVADLYCFSLGPSQGMDPALLSWWDYVESSLCFLRPLSSLSLWIDHAWLWGVPALPHLHSVLWFMGLWLGWRRVFLRYLPANVANLALLLTALSGFVSLTVIWIASRHALVGGCLAVWGLYHCLASRDDPPAGATTADSARPSLRELLGWSLIGLGLLSSEMALGSFGFLLAREWLTRTSSGAFRPGSVARIAGYAACGALYVGVHGALGYGAPKYPLYLDPTGDPWTFLRAVPERSLALAGDLALGLAADLWLYPSASLWLAPIAGFGAVMLASALRDLFREAPDSLRRPLGWLGVGALLSLVPCLGGMQGGRSLTIAGFALFALIAACLLLLPRKAERAAPFRGRLRTLSLATLALGAFVLHPLAHFVWYGVVASLDPAETQALQKKELSCPPGSDVYLVDASQFGASAWYARFWLKDELDSQNFRQLTMIPAGIEAIELSRTGRSSMTLRAIGGTLLSAMAVAPGTEQRIQPGFARRYPDYNVLVKRVGERGPVEVGFGFARPLDAPELCLFVHDDVRLYQIEPPAVGGTLVIRPASPLGDGLLARLSGREPVASPSSPR